MVKQKTTGFIQSVKNEGQPIIFSLLSGWLITLIIFLIKESIIKDPPDALKYTTVATKQGEELIYGYADYIIHEQLLLFVFLIIGISIALFCINKFLYKNTLLFTLPTAFLTYGVLSIYNASSSTPQRAFPAFVFSLLALLIIILCVNYVKSKNSPFSNNDISPRLAIALVVSAFLAISAFWIYLLWSRTASYCSPGFDMGIFAQMLDNMTESKHSFLPMVTCERGEYLSHFAVHFSPILYLLMPFALIFNVLDVLVFAQILVVFSGIFPLFLICRHLKLSNIKSVLLSLLYMLYPAMSSGAFYDFHENAFLAPLILWTLYFSHKKKWYNTLLMFVFALLTLMVKEDAAIYVAFISLFIFFSQKQRLKGFGMFVLAVCYFFFAIFMISQFGEEGNMLGSRYNNVIGKNDSFLALVTTFFANPALYAAELFTADKLIYALNMLLPLAFLPLATRKPSRFLLLGPFLLMNLVTDYKYQFDLGFQYSFGSGALLIYLAAINLADLSHAPLFVCEAEAPPAINAPKEDAQLQPEQAPPLFDESNTEPPKAEREPSCEAPTESSCDGTENAPEPIVESADAPQSTPKRKSSRKRLLTNLSSLALIFSIFSSIFILAGRAPSQTVYVQRMRDEKAIQETLEDTLSSIDRSKSVLATSMLVTYLYDVDELYETNYSWRKQDGRLVQILDFTEYVVLDARPYISASSSNDNIIAKYKLHGYEIIEEHKDIIIVLQRTEKSPPVGPAK